MTSIGNSIRLALLRALDPEAAAVLEAESKRRTGVNADSTAPSAEYLAHREHVQAVEKSLQTFGAPVPQKPSTEPLPEHLREQIQKRISFVPEERA